jgi:biopolymer transport protein TolQ
MKNMTNDSLFSVYNLLSELDAFGFFVFMILFLMSVVSWGLFFYKYMSLKKAKRGSQAFLHSFWKTKNLAELFHELEFFAPSSCRKLFQTAFEETALIIQSVEHKPHLTFPIPFENIKRTLLSQRSTQEMLLSKYLYLFSLFVSTTPFIGLFGTVIGIMKAFQDIGLKGSAQLASVAPGISEALLATALGLFVAIPSMFFHSLLVNEIKKHLALLDHFSVDYLNLIERYYNIDRKIK